MEQIWEMLGTLSFIFVVFLMGTVYGAMIESESHTKKEVRHAQWITMEDE